MIVAVNTRSPAGDFSEDVDEFVFETFSWLAKKHPQHQFIYFFDGPFDEKLITSKNISAVVVGPVAKSTLLWPYWYNYKIPAVLRKHKADVFFSADGICSLRTKTPQCLLIPGAAFLALPQLVAKDHLRFYKKFTPKFLTKAAAVATLSASAKATLVRHYKIDPEKTEVIVAAPAEIYQSVSHEQRESIKEKYAGGKEYFLFTGRLSERNNLLNLLKAFSFFKKRQKSNMQLVIATNGIETGSSFTKSLATFKFRDEVKLLTGLFPVELAAITAAAYAFVYPVLYEDIALKPLEAMQCEVPVITSDTGAIAERCGGAALYVNPDDYNDIAEKMMLLFKDEVRRRELIGAGKLQVQQHDRAQTAAQLWSILLKTIK